MVILICGKSAVGKDSVVKEISRRTNHINKIISYTTRPMRDGEADGVDYIFVSKSEFLKLISDNDLTEYTSYIAYNGTETEEWFYGTPKLDSNKDYIGVVNPYGIEKFKDKYKDDVKVIFIDAPNHFRKSRAIKRGGFNEIEWKRRLEKDDIDFKNIYQIIDYGFVNKSKEDFEEIVEYILNMLQNNIDK